MAPKSAVKCKAALAAQVSAVSRKKKRESLELVGSLPRGSEAALSSTISRSPAATGERSDVISPEGESIAVPSTISEEPSVAGPSSSVVEPSITPLESESLTQAAGVRSDSEEKESASNRTPQEILKGFAEDWLDTLD